MDVRDAVEADADRLAELTGSPRDVMRNLVHDRTVRVVEADDVDTGDGSTAGAGGDGEGPADGGTDRPDANGDAIRGFVSFDARADTVHITQFESEAAVADRLLAEPIRFADREDMAVEFLVAEDESSTREAAEAAGFRRDGAGPTFEGQPTVRYRLDP